MRRLFIIMISLLAMMAGMNAMAQEIKITLHPGWNWIGYTDTEVKSISEALGDFVPMAGDKIKSDIQNTTYKNGTWRGRLIELIPGYGYKYYSSRTEDVEFSFVLAHSVYVETTEPTDITGNSAVVGGTITISEGSHVFVRGVCWGTEPEPDIDGSHTSDGNETGSFSSTIDGLFTGTTYYVRAYAVYDHGVSYGESLSFTTVDTPTGAINGKFTINDNGNQVFFSQGNLQYIGSAETPYWKFADHQWDYLGETTGQNSSDENVDRDLFGWGTSGYDHGAICYQPWSTSTTYSDYYAYGDYWYNLYDQTGQADWGYNPISNGGNSANTWRTLTPNEWWYVFLSRSTTSGIRYANGKVNGVNGVILLPDDWSNTYYSLSNTNNEAARYTSNTISASQWNTLEQHGAVFLPAAGDRYGTDVDHVGSCGIYWSATNYNHISYLAQNVYFNSDYMGPGDGYDDRSYGLSVRLVCSSSQVVSYSVTAQPNLVEGGTIEGAGTYSDGQICTLTALANRGYTFVNWTENDEVVTTDATYSFEVTCDRELVANFTQLPTGSINGKFTVNSNGDQVYFSQGNLQYIGSASTPYWKFANNQWDYLDTLTGQNSNDQNVDRDLFGWGTSGYNHGAVCYQPWSTSTTTSDYYAYGDYQYNLNDQTGQADWGYNAISNGGNQPNQWRTLTKDEWVYVCNTRSTASGIRYAKAQVNGVNGMILLPDDWSSSYYSLSTTNTFSSNIISASEWNSLEQHGAVFLPVAGRRRGTNVIAGRGYYWLATINDNDEPSYISIYIGTSLLIPNSRGNGFSVRLVCSAE